MMLKWRSLLEVLQIFNVSGGWGSVIASYRGRRWVGAGLSGWGTGGGPGKGISEVARVELAGEKGIGRGLNTGGWEWTGAEDGGWGGERNGLREGVRGSDGAGRGLAGCGDERGGGGRGFCVGGGMGGVGYWDERV
ncbi:hypothetical protein Tco_0576739 [Tanacetum coccineum]